MTLLKTAHDAIVQSCEWLCSHLVPVGAGIKNTLADLPLSAVRMALALGPIVEPQRGETGIRRE